MDVAQVLFANFAEKNIGIRLVGVKDDLFPRKSFASIEILAKAFCPIQSYRVSVNNHLCFKSGTGLYKSTGAMIL